MSPSGRRGFARGLEALASRVSEWSGSSWAFAGAAGLVGVWVLTGPLFDFSDTWQLVINTVTNIVTFLMVFLIQRAQNKDAAAIHLKLNELVAAVDGASNRLISIEDLTEEEIRALRRYYRKLVEIAERDEILTRSHSIEEAVARARRKRQRQQQVLTTATTAGDGGGSP
jgi:low affinity Fe/Cu permease